MVYNLKTDNYKNFDVFSKNLMYPRSYFIPFKSMEELENTDIRNERYSSSMVECLSGEWDFKYYSNCFDIPNEIDTNSIKFDRISVPSTWQFTGYEQPYYVNTRYQFKPNPPEIPGDCPAGIYRKIFKVENTELNYYLCFLGVAGGLDLFVNGEHVGYSECAHNTAQFELNKFIVKGNNEIVVVNHKWTNSTYLECQDMFRNNGIFRDVLLYKTGNNSVYDIEIKTRKSGEQYSLEILPSLKITEDCQLSAMLLDDGEPIASVSVNQSKNDINALDFGLLDVKEWSAEKPYLYDLIVTLSVRGEVAETIRRQLGFKHIEIKGNVFFFNSQPIKLLGVNHHDTNPKTGYVMTIEDMERDISLVKQYNGNCIRTSHYPPDPAFLDLCDEYGIYVVDEADIETHGCEVELKRPGACSHNPKWRNHYWDRVYRMFERDKNHPCITMWSLGNESHGYANQDYCYNQLKKFTDIPIHYEGVCRTRRWAYDVVSQMYTWPSVCEKIARGHGLPKKFYKKPYYLCEYAHAMGVGAGELERYVKCFYSAENMLGGCIWEFVDHAVYHDKGQYEYTYGGDHGEWKHDSNFCVDGLFFPDRTPHAGAKQMKNCYRPIRAHKKDNSLYSFFNHRYFENAKMTVKYKVIVGGEVINQDKFEINIPPQSAKEYRIEAFDIKDKNAFVQFEYYEGDFAVGSEEFAISNAVNKFENNSKAPKVEESEKRLFVYLENGRMIFNLKTGFIDSLVYNGKEMINQTPSSDFKGLGIEHFIAPLDNDMYIKILWDKYRLDRLITKVKGCKYKITDNCLEITSIINVKSPIKLKVSKNLMTLRVYNDGTILAGYKCIGSGQLKFVPRYGVQLEMPKKFKNVKYFGLGPDVNLPDFKEHALMGVYETDSWNMHENHIKPQESATRCNTYFAEICDDEGDGIRIDAVNKPFVFSVNTYAPYQCAKAMHRDDLTKDTTCVNIDSDVLGAGSNSCGPLTSKPYRLGSLKYKELVFAIKPLR